MEFDLEYKLQLFREEQPELFDAKGKRYTGTELSNRTAEMMFELINELESALAKAETVEEQLTIPDVVERAFWQGRKCIKHQDFEDWITDDIKSMLL